MSTFNMDCINDFDRKMIFHKERDDNNKEQIYIEEYNENQKCTLAYKCTEFSNNDFNIRLKQLIDKAINHNSIKILSARWYPFYDKQMMCGYGPVYITPIVECRGKRIKLTLKFGYTDSSSTYIYVITGYKAIENFMEFLNC